ncbi:MAG: hypothetical protein E5W98_02850 [Mesorhizobium sp.]|nr:MAG: hypothetical protein EOS34_01995 [Mesorhizobium sp.]RWD44644.1 MAG: hypothetical protein EOS35_16570 [Mesorhizobium sp.]TKD48129.1 MAG: hypothetical protein E5W98_02850 [Mesorhizobium sp.]
MAGKTVEVEMLRAALLFLTLCFAATEVSAQPDIRPRPGVTDRLLDRSGVSAPAAKRRAHVADRIKRGAADRPVLRPRSRISDIVDGRLVSTTIRSGLEAVRLAQIQKKKRDINFLGLIDSMTIGGVQISLERRKVRTGRGLQSLLLTQAGGQYVYDGDMVVPPFAIGGIGFPLSEQGAELPANITFAAGYAGTFGAGPLWDDAIIPFEVADDFCCNEDLASAIADYEERTVFRFVPRDGHETYIRFINSEPILSSRTELGKQRGENAVRIQGVRLDGTPAGGLIGTIQHEIGHELGLIHEHLRSDRDLFIERNPGCAPADIFQGIYEGWIDMTNVAFTEDGAELLTDYDFASLMHYNFGLDTDGDGTVNCSPWVRLGGCTGPACIDNFSSDLLSDRDIEGLHKLYIAVPGSNNFLPEPDQVRSFNGDNVRHRGKRIDRCLHGLPFGQDACSATSRGRVADEFCEAKGFQDGFNVQTEGMLGEHSGFHAVVGWMNVWGGDVISSISCQNLTPQEEQVVAGTLEEETFSGSEVEVSDRRIDRCMHGDDITGDRCSAANQGRIADAFCEQEGFDEASAFETDFGGPNAFMSGFFPSDDDFKDVAGLDQFTEISCVR